MTVHPADQIQERPPTLRADEDMPRYGWNLVQHVIVNADPVRTYHAIRTANVAGPFIRLMVSARNLPLLLHRGPERRKLQQVWVTLDDVVAPGTGWVRLAEEPGVEYVYGLVGQFWRRDFGIVPVAPEEFAAFDRAGYAKTLAALTMRPYGAGRTLLSYESRTVTTDEAARRRFGRYWIVLRPFARQVMRSALIAIKREAEGLPQRHPTTAFAPGDR